MTLVTTLLCLKLQRYIDEREEELTGIHEDIAKLEAALELALFEPISKWLDTEDAAKAQLRHLYDDVLALERLLHIDKLLLNRDKEQCCLLLQQQLDGGAGMNRTGHRPAPRYIDEREEELTGNHEDIAKLEAALELELFEPISKWLDTEDAAKAQLRHLYDDVLALERLLHIDKQLLNRDKEQCCLLLQQQLDGGAGPPPPSTVFIAGSPVSTNTFASIVSHLPSHDEEAGNTAIYNLRPYSTSMDIAPPVRAMFAGFGLIADAFYLGAYDTLLHARWFEGAHALCDMSARLFLGADSAALRRHAMLQELTKIWPNIHFGTAFNTAGSVLVPVLWSEGGFLAAIIEFRDETYCSGDAALQCQRYIQIFYAKVAGRFETGPVLRATGAPVLVMAFAGPTFGTYGAYLKDGNRVVCEPLTPMLHLLNLNGRDDGAHLSSVARVLAACYVSVSWLKNMYEVTGHVNERSSPRERALQRNSGGQALQATVGSAGRSPATLTRHQLEPTETVSDVLRAFQHHQHDYHQLWMSTMASLETLRAAASERNAARWPWPLPYPVRHSSSYEGIETLGVRHKLLFRARLSSAAAGGAPGMRVLIKFTGAYSPQASGMVHEAWAQAGLAPQLIECMRLPGGPTMVVMAHVRQDDGWRMLCALELDSEEQKVAFETARNALLRAQGIRIPGGDGVSRATVHGDIRGPNIMVKQDERGAWHVRFIDFDWAGLEGIARYPTSLFDAPAQGWHEEARAGRLMCQKHDTFLLEKLGKVGRIGGSQTAA
ncbi:hypothetical protein JKP88DRAFT_293060 [Tribonema minus]|uniref:Protein kinase domain-containing protein n=1 Tax=Tribonema minus TaxID=303371 RepID=A0A835ZI36_9STRA|nr:hypothetical protein JKP88DRAFT_293060 [Tribonema minus]